MAKTMRPTGLDTTDKKRYMRDYQARRRGSGASLKTLAEDAAVIVAVAAGEVTEGRAARVLGVDRIELRTRLRAMLGMAAERCRVETSDVRFETFWADATMNAADDGGFRAG